MVNNITYGPHLFPAGPLAYIRAGGRDVTEAHENIVRTLAVAFSDVSHDTLLAKLSTRFGVNHDSEVNLSFMNYGDTQLVYLATIANKLKFAVLVNQPHTPLGRTKEEFDNLTRLFEMDGRFVVKALDYFALPRAGHEVYATRYVENAMCVAVKNEHGVYDPLPVYHFERFSPQVSSSVNASMIALLINYYDKERGMGIAKTQVSGNDFMLTRNFRRDDPASVLPNMRLIAARGLVKATLPEYIGMLMTEFGVGTNRTEMELANMRVNHRSKLAMTPGEIETGISMGLIMRGTR